MIIVSASGPSDWLIMQLQDKGHNCESYSFGVIPLFNLNF